MSNSIIDNHLDNPPRPVPIVLTKEQWATARERCKKMTFMNSQNRVEIANNCNLPPNYNTGAVVRKSRSVLIIGDSIANGYKSVDCKGDLNKVYDAQSN